MKHLGAGLSLPFGNTGVPQRTILASTESPQRSMGKNEIYMG